MSSKSIVLAAVAAGILLIAASTSAGAGWQRPAVVRAGPADAGMRPGDANVVAGQSGGESFIDAVSADGRYVVFDSDAPNLVRNDTNDSVDVFVRDRLAGTTERVSVGAAGKQGDSDGYGWSISADGRYVAFESWADNLVPGDTNWSDDVFVRDRLNGTTQRVSVAAGGGQADWDSFGASMSADGRYVAFTSQADNLVPGDTNDSADVYVRDRMDGTTERVSAGPGGAQGDSDSYRPAISADGRVVAYQSWADNLVPGDTNRSSDVFAADRQAGTTERVSVGAGGVQGNDYSFYNAVSGDGRFVVFGSYADDLVPGDTNSNFDIFVRDRALGATERVSVGDSGEADSFSELPVISADGRYVAYDSDADNLVPTDTNGTWDVFVRDRSLGTTERASIGSGGESNDASGGAALSPDGRYAGFSSFASNLVAGDTNDAVDAFVRDRTGGTTDRASLSVDAPAIASFEPASGVGGSPVTIRGTSIGGATAVLFNNVPAPDLTTVDPGTITTHVPAAATSGKITVIAAGGKVTSSAVFKVVPAITAVTPGAGSVGAPVTISGTGFGGISSVRFNGAAASYTVSGATVIRTGVPSSATSGTVTVTGSGGTASSPLPFTVTPKVAGFAPASGPAGTVVSISGSAFDGTSAVTFNGTAAAGVIVVSAKLIKVPVPPGATTGTIGVTTSSGSGMSVGAFKVTPRITGFTNHVRVGETVLVTGTNLDEATALRLGALAVTIAPGDSTHLSFVVPEKAVTGSLKVTTRWGSYTTASSLGVRPTIDASDPDTGVAGSTVTLTGKTLAGVSSVKFAGLGGVGTVPASFSVVNSATVKAKVPAAASTGPLTVTNAGGSTDTADTVTVTPRIGSLSPPSGGVGSLVAIDGSGFDLETAVSFFDGRQAVAPQLVSGTRIKVTVPAGATTGALQLTTGGGSATGAGVFRVTPTITDFTNHVRVGETVQVTGTNLDEATALKLGALAVTITPGDSTHLSFVVPEKAVTGKLSVTTQWGGYTTTSSLGVRPTIDAWDPGSGAAGSTVTLTGKTFSGISSVMFAGLGGVGSVAASYSISSSTTLKVRVPADAVSGPIRVTSPAGSTDTADAFVVLPKVGGFTPVAGATGSTVTINGSGFDATTEVQLGGKPVGAPQILGATRIRAIVPDGALTGQTVRVTTNGGTTAAQSAGTFLLTFGINGFTPASGSVWTAVVVSGTALANATLLKFNGVTAEITARTPWNLTTLVPDGATTGRITVTTPAGTVQSADDFVVAAPDGPSGDPLDPLATS